MIKTHTGEIIKPTIFPDGTSQVWNIGEDNFRTPFATIEWTFENEAELIHIAQLKLLFEALGKPVHLSVPYLPYARQDKEITNNSTFALHSFVTLLNSLNFESITAFDPHPLIVPFLQNFTAIKPDIEINKTILECNADSVCFPDKGALDRYSRFVRTPWICGNKTRNQSTGNITSHFLSGEYADRSVLIVDDICDGGSTFIKIATLLKEKTAKEINLYVSHGLFTKGIQILRDAGINRIFTRNVEIK